jgi:hypothetical protein
MKKKNIHVFKLQSKGAHFFKIDAFLGQIVILKIRSWLKMHNFKGQF